MEIMFAKFIFKQVDILFDIPQNIYTNCKCIRQVKNAIYNPELPKVCKLDIYCEGIRKHKTCPVFINIHGGGFVAGDKYYRRGFCKYVASLGFKVVNINYGLCPEYKFPTFIDQIAQAVKWCEAHSMQYGLDMSKAIISGDSAGAYLAQSLILCSTDSDYANKLNITQFDTKFIGAALFCGPYMPTIAFSDPKLFLLGKELWWAVTGEKIENVDQLKEYKHFDLLDIGDKVNTAYPPIFITHSNSDIFCKGHAPILIDHLQKYDIPVWEVHSIDDMHDWHEIMNIKSSRQTLKLFRQYLNDCTQNAIPKGEYKSITIKEGKVIKQ